jgi:hypothetical protein
MLSASAWFAEKTCIHIYRYRSPAIDLGLLLLLFFSFSQKLRVVASLVGCIFVFFIVLLSLTYLSFFSEAVTCPRYFPPCLLLLNGVGLRLIGCQVARCLFATIWLVERAGRKYPHLNSPHRWVISSTSYLLFSHSFYHDLPKHLTRFMRPFHVALVS